MSLLRVCLAMALLGCLPAVAQVSPNPPDTSGAPHTPPPTASLATKPASPPAAAPFSRLAFGGGIGILGINLQAATNLNRSMNLRASGNVFSYTVNDISSNGFNANGNLNLASMGIDLDFFPFPRHGFRLSPGVLVLNQNTVSMVGVVPGNETFTLNHVDYRSSPSDPVRARANLGLNATKPAFTMTTGWGNMIPRKGGHFSFPFELGAAFVGVPSLNMVLTGTACDSSGKNCVDAATDPNLQADLQAQLKTYRHDLEPLKVLPILSVGVSYSFTLSQR